MAASSDPSGESSRATPSSAEAAAPSAPLLRLEGISVRFGDHLALDEVDLEVAEHRSVCVLGPSGSGKSTLLRVVAGLQHPDRGRVLLRGADQASVPAHRRGLGLMFQDQQLFPQRDVGGNIAFGLRMRGASRPESEQRVAELLELVGLPHARRRAVTSLSGGEQQRVALARALAPQPGLLMLDEPLGQLDRGLRERLVVELRGLFRRLGTTVLAVTHDQGEAFALADQVVVMRDGRVEQSGSPLEVWRRPVSEFVARFLGFGNIVPATVRGVSAQTPWGDVPVPEGTPQGRGDLLIRPSGVRLHGLPDSAPAAGAPSGVLRGRVVARSFRGDHVVLHLEPEWGPRLEAACPLRWAPEEGSAVQVTFDPEETVVLGG